MTIYLQKCLVPPTVLAVDLEIVKDFLHIDDDEDEILRLLIQAATRKFENYTDRAIIHQQWQVTYSYKGENAIRIPVLPIVGVTKVETKSLSNNWYEIGDKMWELEGDSLYMSTLSFYQYLRVTYVAGMAKDSREVPEDVRAALLQYIGYLYENRGGRIDVDGMDLSLKVYERFKHTRLG